MAIDYARVSRAVAVDAITRMSFEDRANDVRAIAIGAVNDYHDIAPVELDETAFNAAVVTMVSKLDTAMPSVGSDLSALSDQQIATLANSLELAEWDWRMRVRLLRENHRYWLRRGSHPDAATYLAMWKTMANYVRSKRGLTAIA